MKSGGSSAFMWAPCRYETYLRLSTDRTEQADLTGADLRGANLEGARFGYATLTDVTWTDRDPDTETICPSGELGPYPCMTEQTDEQPA